MVKNYIISEELINSKQFEVIKIDRDLVEQFYLINCAEGVYVWNTKLSQATTKKPLGVMAQRKIKKEKTLNEFEYLVYYRAYLRNYHIVNLYNKDNLNLKRVFLSYRNDTYFIVEHEYKTRSIEELKKLIKEDYKKGEL